MSDAWRAGKTIDRKTVHNLKEKGAWVFQNPI